MKYISTRGKGSAAALEAILQGAAPDGGLFVPEEIPVLSEEFFARLPELSYEEIGAELLSKFIPELSYEELLAVFRASAAQFELSEAAPVFKVGEELFMLELWHGPTAAFKDIALTVLPQLVTLAKQKLGHETGSLFLTATSGDTGAAALEGFRDVPGTKVLVFYPDKRVSTVQRLQMQTARGENVRVHPVLGDFDDAQRAVKRVFRDGKLNAKLKEAGWELTSANSINLGRLLPQIVYYFSSYALLLDSDQLSEGEKVNFAVPSGNFGNILAGYYAKRMGLPIGMLICASNGNSVLADFLETGEYDADRPLKRTISPSMDILVSGNVERLIFEVTGRDAARTKELMECLAKEKKYKLTDAEFATVKESFYGDSCGDDETYKAIENMFDAEEYAADPHTAVALSCNANYVAETGDAAKTIVISTASPFKFARHVLRGLGKEEHKKVEDNFAALKELTADIVPESLLDVLSRPIRFSEAISPRDAEKAVLDFVRQEDSGKETE